MVLAKLDAMGKLAWLGVILIAFWTAWPLGLAVLAYLVGSGRLRTWFESPGTWCNMRSDGQGGSGALGRRRRTVPSGNQAFDDYREETLRRLEEEQREFQTYLERLRRARDKAEFDGFMAERRRSAGPIEPMGGAEPA